MHLTIDADYSKVETTIGNWRFLMTSTKVSTKNRVCFRERRSGEKLDGYLPTQVPSGHACDA